VVQFSVKLSFVLALISSAVMFQFIVFFVLSNVPFWLTFVTWHCPGMFRLTFQSFVVGMSPMLVVVRV